MAIWNLKQFDKIRDSVAFDFFLRILACACVGFFAVNLSAAYHADKSRITLLAAIFSETATIIVLLISRRPKVRDWHWLSVFATIYASFLTLPLITVTNVYHFLPDNLAIIIQSVALLWIINAKITIGRSFGLLPADRGIIDTGVYKFVRHPIYLGYGLLHVGFLFSNFNVQNTLVYVSLYIAQIYRILMEEKILMS